jgi:hypothetical protein
MRDLLLVHHRDKELKSERLDYSRKFIMFFLICQKSKNQLSINNKERELYLKHINNKDNQNVPTVRYGLVLRIGSV